MEPAQRIARSQSGASLVDAVAALAIAVLVLAAAAGLFQRVGTALVAASQRGRQVEAAFQAASSARRSGAADSPIEGFAISVSSRQASWGTDAQLAFRDPNPSCQGDCTVDPAGTVNASFVHTVTAAGAGGLSDVRLVVVRATTQ